MIRAPSRILGGGIACVWRYDARCGVERCDFEVPFEGNGRIIGKVEQVGLLSSSLGLCIILVIHCQDSKRPIADCFHY